MGTFQKTAATVMAMSGLLCGCGSAAAETHWTLVIHVQDYQRLEAREFADAQRSASQAYARIGVRLVWATTAVEATADANDGAQQFDVVILDAPMVAAKEPPAGTLGQAIREARRAYIYYPRVIAQARKSGSGSSRMLGYVLAHEIGHLVLAARGHSAKGLMQPHCDARVVDVPDFLPEQARSIRAWLAQTVGDRVSVSSN